MEMLERYLYQIGKHLPNKDKEDILKELKYSILDEYDNSNKNQESLEKILIKLGSPREVAGNYKSKYFISKEIEPLYLLIIKILSFSITLGLFVLTIVKFLTSGYEYTLTNIIVEFAKTIPDILVTIISATGSVTVIFLLIDRFTTLNESIIQEKFDPKKLQPVPRKVNEVSRAEQIFIILFLTLIIYLLNINHGFILIINGESVNLFNENINSVMLILNILITVSIVISGFHFIKGFKTKISLYMSIILDIVSASVLIYLATGDIINKELLDKYQIPSISITISRIGFFIGGVITIAKSIKMIILSYFKS